MSSFFDTNKNILLQKDKYLSWFLNDIFIKPYPLVKAKNGELTCLIDGKWICSRYSPEEEAKKFTEALNVKKGDMIVLYGFGLGYHIQHILNAIGRDGYLYCIETSTKLLKTALCVKDLSGILSDSRLKIITGANNDDLAVAFDHYIFWNLEKFPSEKIKVVIHEPSFSLITEEFSWIKNSLELIKFERRGDTFFHEEIKANLKANFEVLFESGGIGLLKDIFKGNPVTFVGAGHSLDKCSGLLKTLQNNTFIVAADTALIPLRKYGIKPDFVISVDPQDKSIENFLSYENETTPLIILPSSSREVVKKVKGKKIIAVQKGSMVSDFFEGKLEDCFGVTFGGGAVSVIGLDIIFQQTGGVVILAGMDYAFPFYKSYANYSPLFKNWQTKTGPYYTLEMASLENIYSRKIIYTENFMGEKIPTHQSMYSYLRSLETVIEYHKRNENNLYILTPMGARIKGVKPLLFNEEFISLLEAPIKKDFELKVPVYSRKITDYCREKIKTL